jgi:hypothetical protein
VKDPPQSVFVLSVCHHNRLGRSGFQTFFLLLLIGNTRLRRFPCSSPAHLAGAVIPAILHAMPEPKLYPWSTVIGTACNQKSRSFQDLAEKLKMDVHQLVRECNAKVPPSKALVKGLAKELDLSESMLDRLAEEVRKDLGAK